MSYHPKEKRSGRGAATSESSGASARGDIRQQQAAGTPPDPRPARYQGNVKPDDVPMPRAKPMPAGLFLPRLPDSPEPEVVSAADAPGTSSAAAATAAPAEKRDSPDSSGGSGGSTPPLRFNIADVSLPDLCQKSLEEVAEEMESVQAQFVSIKNKRDRRSRADA